MREFGKKKKKSLGFTFMMAELMILSSPNTVCVPVAIPIVMSE